MKWMAAENGVPVINVRFARIAAAGVGVLAGLALLTSAGPASAATIPAHIVVPAYWYPGTSSWSDLAADGSPTVSGAVLNPCAPDGTCSPGDAVNPATRSDLQQDQAVGITFYGYVWTDYGSVPIATVESEIHDYAAWYGLKNIFLDGASTSCATESSYYLPLYKYVHALGGKVILNPGTTSNSCYMAASDLIDMFEGTQASLGGWSQPSWMRSYSQSRFIATVYGVTGSAAMQSSVRLAGTGGFGNVYVTDQSLPNPYGQLPSYWSSEVSYLGG
jgi:Spherulation-specific family 4